MSDLYLVDDHEMWRDFLRTVLQTAGHRVLGESDDPTEALAEIQRLGPDIVLLDLHLGQRSGFEFLEKARARKLRARTIVLTMSDRARDVAQALRMGAAGYVLKGSPAAELQRAVEAVAQGRRHLAPDAAELAAQTLVSGEEGGVLDALSVRERQVLRLVVLGWTSAAIGEELHLSPKTVESYRSRLMAKVGVRDLAALVRLAIREKLISADS